MGNISTDVDKVLEYVKSRKRAELIEVARSLNLKAMDVDKWAKILEKEGLVEIEYNLTKMYIIWNGRNSVSADYAQIPNPSKSPEPKPAETAKKRIKKKSKTERRIAKTKGGKDGIESIIRKRVAKGKDGKDGIESIIRKRVAKVEGGKDGIESIIRKRVAKVERGKDGIESIIKKRVAKVKRGKDADESVDLGKANKLSMLLKNKVEAINNSVAEIADLKSEKEKLYNSEYMPLVSRFDSALSSLGEKLAERETAVIALKRKIVELPDVIAQTEIELEGSSKTLKELEDEYESQLKKLEAMRSNVERAREQVKSDLALSKNSVNACIGSLTSVEKGIESVNSLREKCLKRIEEARQKIDEENQIIEKMAALVDGAQIQVDELNENVDEIMKRINGAHEIINTLELQHQNLQNAEEVIASLQQAYEAKKEELKSVIEQRESELNSLRLEVEQGFLQKYLRELNKLSEEHEEEANEIINRDEDIELKLKAARERLKQLLKESRELSRKFESGI